ncbi:putative membrane protein YdfK [bioreactor metagenome]|uniref:Putative membrane protein YdfK n=1 Tax=bioreactor metagenome TaxID=1076179 RepID=A0A645GWV1_9ZZZZ
MHALALFTFGLGVAFFMKSQEIMIVIASLLLGTLIGEIIDIEKRLESLGNSLQSKVKGVGGSFSEGFVTASLLFCVGSMAIMGSLQSGLSANHEVLYAKAVMDLVAALIFAAAMGLGVAMSAVPVLIYEGSLSLLASVASPYLSNAVVDEMTAVGGVLLMGLALSILEIKKIRVGNMIPGIFLPIIIMLFMK